MKRVCETSTVSAAILALAALFAGGGGGARAAPPPPPRRPRPYALRQSNQKSEPALYGFFPIYTGLLCLGEEDIAADSSVGQLDAELDVGALDRAR